MKEIRPRLTEKEYNLVLESRNSFTVGVIADTHAPFEHPKYFDFCRSVFDQWNIDEVVHIGDEVDNHALSYHENSIDAESVKREMENAIGQMQKWYKAFPEVKVCIGNHTALPFRKATTAGIPHNIMKSYNDIMQAPSGWKWSYEHEINGVVYLHGTGGGGKYAAINRAIKYGKPVVQGHTHVYGGSMYHKMRDGMIFGLNVGCGIDTTAYAFEYARAFTDMPTLGCGIVKGQMGIFVPFNGQ